MTKRLCAAGLKWHLPLALVVTTIIGLTAPRPGRAVAENTPLSTICIIGIFLISGLKLKTADLRRAVKAWQAPVAGFVSILAVTPLIGFGLVEIPFRTRELARGLAIFSAMPSTISSAVILTGEAKGNVALALLFSVGSNLLGTITAPLFLSVFLSSSSDGEISISDLLQRLSLTILVPLIAGKLLQWVPHVPAVVARFSTVLKLFSSFLLVLIPCVPCLIVSLSGLSLAANVGGKCWPVAVDCCRWMKLSESAESLFEQSVGALFAVLGLGVAMHLVYLAFNYGLGLAIRVDKPERTALLISGSQKTMGIAVAVVDALPESVGEGGLLLVPVLLAHFGQIIVDAILAVWLRPSVEEVSVESEHLSSDTPVEPPESVDDTSNRRLAEQLKFATAHQAPAAADRIPREHV